MKKLQDNLAVKLLAVLLCAACAVGTFCGLIYTARHWDGLFGRGYTDSGDYYSTLQDYNNTLHSILEYAIQEEMAGSLPYLQREAMDEMAAQLASDKTNYRFVVRDAYTGATLFSNTNGQALDFFSDSLHTIHVSDWMLYEDGVYDTPPTVLPQQVVLESSTLSPFVYEDPFLWGEQSYAAGDPFFVGLTVAGGVVTLALLIFLGYCAGHKKGVAGVRLNWQDHIPYDLYLFLMFWLLFGGIGMTFSFLEHSFYYDTSSSQQLGLGLSVFFAAVTALLAIAAILSTVTRIKSRTIFRNTLTWRICRAVFRSGKRAVAALPLSWRWVLGFLGFLFINAILSARFFLGIPYGFGLSFLLLLVFNGLVLVFGCRWSMQWRTIRSGTARIVGGDTDAKIDTDKMLPDLKQHADQLNDLNTAINSAVEERIKSERFKAELITNVSHDLKTPLTSIINYVDLLKKQPIDNPTVQEYIEVLDRKSQRLKKLTEDLVEASKASTGTLTVNRERIGVSQLVGQASAEYSDRLGGQSLELVTTLPEDEAYVWADGRHVWRILDNLLSNCCKYAMPGSRVYLDVAARGDRVYLTMKNVSKDPLNVPAEQLLARFVRGDEARSTEGSGLGLSIAQSLTELQGGAFTLTVDGDFFKAEVSLPRAGSLTRDAVL